MIDSAPHKLTDAQRDAMMTLSRIVIRQMELRDAINREFRSALSMRLIVRILLHEV
ncbi:MAG: hypothetical protein ABIT70_15940 [Sulfuriferula sp.]